MKEERKSEINQIVQIVQIVQIFAYLNFGRKKKGFYNIKSGK
jgi:hypothetical protein